MKRSLSLLLAGLMTAMLFSGCSSGSNSSSSAPASTPATPASSAAPVVSTEPKDGGILKVALSSSPKNLDPKFRTSLYESTILDQVLDSLITYSNDQSKFVPSLAKDWTISDDGLVYTFTLRDDVYFHAGKFQDGRKFVAEDVKYSLERAKEARNVTLVMLDTVEVIDEVTVKCTLKNPDAIFMDALTGPTNMIVPKEEVEGWGEDFGKHLIGTGPFQLVEFKLDQETTLERNDKYWGPRPHLDGVVFKVITDATQTTNALKTGEVDLATTIRGEGVKLIQEDANLQLMSKPNTSINFIGFNLEDPVMKDIRVRQALSMTINTDELCKGIYQYNEGTAAHQPMPRASWGYDEAMEQYAYEYNIDKAKQLLADAGYKDGLKVKLTMASSEINTRLATILQQLWKTTLNVDLEIDTSEFAVYSETVTGGKHQMYIAGISSTVDPHNFTGKCLASKYTGTIPAGCRMNSPEMDALVLKSVEKGDIASRKPVYLEIVKLAMEQYPAIYFSNDNITWGASNKVQGLTQKTYWYLCNAETNVWLA